VRGFTVHSATMPRHGAPVISRLNDIITGTARWGFWKCFHWMRLKGNTCNHKRVWTVYKSMKPNLPRRAKRRLRRWLVKRKAAPQH